MIRNIPEIYKNVDIGSINPIISLHCRNISESKKWKKGVYLYGKPGVGKTYALYAMRKFFSTIDFGSPETGIVNLDTMVVKSMDIVNAIRNTFVSPQDPESREYREYQDNIEFLNELKKVHILFIDDVGVEKMSEAVLSRYHEIIDTRCDNRMPLSFTSNLDLNELRKTWGARMISRITSCCESLELTGVDRRNSSNV